MSELFGNVLNVSIQGGIMILAVLVLRLVLKKAPKKYICLLWMLVGVRLLMPFSIESGLSLQPLVEPVKLDQVVSVPVPVAGPDISESNAEVPNPSVEFELPENMEQTSYLYKVEDGRIEALTFGDLAAVFWAAAAGLMLFYGILSYAVLKLRLREAVRMSGDVWESDWIDTAFILGYLRPRIYLPMGLNENTRELILRHERGHLKRCDHWVKLIGFEALAMHWFNPLVWVGYMMLCRDIEMACDEQAVRSMSLGERKSYSAALLSCSTNHSHHTIYPLAFGEVSVKQRIRNVLHYRRPGFWVSLAAAAAVIMVAVCFLTNPEKPVSDEWEAECRAVLEEIQDNESYYIRVEHRIEEEGRLNQRIQSEYWQYGGNYLCISKKPNSGTLETDGILYDGTSGHLILGGDNYEGVYQGVSDNWEMEWRQEDTVRDIPSAPWLYTFDIDAQEVEAISRRDTGEGYEIRLMVYGPVETVAAKYDRYYVDFCFDRQGNFRYAVQYVYGTGRLNGEPVQRSFISTMYRYECSEEDFRKAMETYADDLNWT